MSKIIDNIAVFYSDQIAVERNLERFQYIINLYQEQPHLLDPHLELLLSQLLSIVMKKDSTSPVIYVTFKFLYFITKTRGHKVIVRMMPHEVADLDPILTMLSRETPSNSETWETKYMLFLWLSIVAMIPFDMSRLDSHVNVEGRNEKKPTMDRILDVGKDYLDVVDKSRDAAAYMLSRFLTRPDVKRERLSQFIEWSMMRLERADLQTAEGVQSFSGTLMVLASLFKSGKREDLLDYVVSILDRLRKLSLQEHNNTLLRKLSIKAVQRLGLTFLKARVAAWRYQRGSRSITDNLTASTNKNVVVNNDDKDAKTVDQKTENDDDYEVPEEIEEVIEMLLAGLRDKDTVVRWSAAKGIGRVTGRLPLALADEVVGSIMELFTVTQTDAAWHGGCLALAELGRRGLLLPNRLEDVVPVIIQALNYDEKRANYSVGANVRDSACYICWAFARAYDVKELEPYVSRIAESLVIVSVFDREVNVRRAAAAAFQENVGRQGSFPHGIDILTVCDYFAVGNRNHCYLELSSFVAQFEEYTIPLIDHLITVKISHWDASLRELASESLHRLTPRAPDYLIKNGLPLLLGKCLVSDINTHHGALLAVSQIVYSLAKTTSANNQNISEVIDEDLMKKLLLLTTQIQEAKYFKGIGGDMMKIAICCLIEKFSLSRLPYHDDAIVDVWQKLINECLEHIDENIQAAAVSAIPAFCSEYYRNPDGLTNDTKCSDLISKYISELDSKIEKTRCGYALALGALPKFMSSTRLMSILSGLIKAATILRKQEAFVESRRDAIKAITSICKTVGADESGSANVTLCSENINIIYEAFFNSLKDYTLDSRGDVGAWVREAALVGLHDVTALLVTTQINLFSPEASKRIFCNLVQQACEKIDRTRGVAGNIFAKLLYHSPSVPFIPHKEELMIIFPETDLNEINWTVPSDTFVRFTKLLSLPTYTYSVLLGLTVSAGGLTESLVKHSMNCFLTFMNDVSKDAAQLKTITDNLLTIFSDYQKVDRVTLCFFKMVDRLLANSCFDTYIRENNSSFPLSLFQMSKLEVSKCKDIQKVLASIDVFCGLLQFSEDVRNKSMVQLMIFLCHAYPIVRKNTANKLYESIVTYDDIIQEEALDEVTSLLTETQWDQPIDVVRPIRNQLCDLLGVPKPTLITK